nr:spore germination protein [Bacillus piscicola]
MQESNVPSDNKSLSDQLTDNKEELKKLYANCSDVVFRSFFLNGKEDALLVYIDGLTQVEEIDDNVLAPLMKKTYAEQGSVRELLKKKVAVASVTEVETYTNCVSEISVGNPVVILEGSSTGFSLGLAKPETRAISEPSSESVVRGPREGFVESLHVNRALLRRKIRSPQLKMETIEIGTYTKTTVIISYVSGLADETLIKEVRNRVARVEIDGVLDSGVLEEFIEDYPYSPFPQVLTTERPDVAAGSLLEGRVVILVDGTPFVMIAPVSLYSFLQASEDYYMRFIMSTLIRWLRYAFLVISLLLPSFYVAVITFHQEMVPTALLISMAASREQLPFPALIEALIMEVTFEALREAGIRLPKQIGAAVSIVGALVIGESAVTAGIVSAPMVIVVALTGIASFTIPRYSQAIALRMLRFPMIILAGTLGILGIMLGIIAIVIHLSTLRSFGVPYLSPMAPMKSGEMKDTLARAPWWKLNARPHFTGAYNEHRQSASQKPNPGKGEE